MSYCDFAVDKVSLKIQSIECDDDSVAMAIVILPQTHVLLTCDQQS